MLKCFCKHKWKILNETNLNDEFGWYKTVYILVCEKCGKTEKWVMSGDDGNYTHE